MNDRDLRRNASGYSDPTAYEAIKNIEKEDEQSHNLRISESYIIGVDISNGEDQSVLTVSRYNGSQVTYVNTFIGEEADLIDLQKRFYKLLGVFGQIK